jgi:hypothetical protein
MLEKPISPLRQRMIDDMTARRFKDADSEEPPVYNGMMAPRDSWMMPPPCNEMIPPGAPRLLAERVFA